MKRKILSMPSRDSKIRRRTEFDLDSESEPSDDGGDDEREL